MFSGLFIAFSIWKYGYLKWKSGVEAGVAPPGFKGYLGYGVSAFRDDFINTGDNDMEVGRWWDMLMYLAFPIPVLRPDDFLLRRHDCQHTRCVGPSQPKGTLIILLFWGVIAALFISFNKFLVQRPLYRNIPEGADVDISSLPGGDDDLVVARGDVAPGFEHLNA